MRVSASTSSSVARWAACWAMAGSSTSRASSTERNEVCASCMRIAMTLARWRDCGSPTIGPPPGPVLIVMTPWISRKRSVSRSVPRATPYFSSISRSECSGAPGSRPSSVISLTMRWASSMAIFCGRKLL